MSTKAASASSPPQIDAPSSSTVKEIEPVGDMSPNPASLKNSTKIASTHDANDVDIQPSGAVDHPAKVGKLSNTSKQIARASTFTGNKSTGNDDAKAAEAEVESLKNLINADLSFMRTTHSRVTQFKEALDAYSKRFDELEKDLANADDFRELKKAVKKLKQEISAKYKDDHDRIQVSLPIFDNKKPTSAAVKKAEEQFPLLNKKDWVSHELWVDDQRFYYKEFEARYLDLRDELKLCLLCFSVFPEDEVLKKRVMIHWWIAEGFVSPVSKDTTNGDTEEKVANEHFCELIQKGFIHPIYKKGKLRRADTCKIQPFVRSMLIKLAEKANFFDFDHNGNPEAVYSNSLRSCLTGKGLAQTENLEKLHALFNVTEAILEFKSEWLSKMKNINVLYLGRWQTSAAHHIEIEDTTTLKMKNANVLDGLENMKHMRLLSLQGISRITELPECISKLTSLKILDLRACHNLETIPDGIGLLKSLTHLDMSECYLLDHMPKRLSQLSNLEVLSGFVVGETGGKNSCTLDDLRKLQKLRKLSIYTGLNKFPEKLHLRDLRDFTKLKKLTITWGRGSVQPGTGEKTESRGSKEDGKKQSGKKGEATNKSFSRSPTTLSNPEQVSGKAAGTQSSEENWETKEKLVEGPCLLPPELKKLDLQCFPDLASRDWMKPCNLNNLQKLYIRGGKFSDLGQFQEFVPKDKWAKVEELRLKYLNELDMDWRELLELFPKLQYLEKVNCPKLTFFPCDQTGVWMKK